MANDDSALPYQIRDQQSWLDFVDFLDQVRRAGGKAALRRPPSA